MAKGSKVYLNKPMAEALKKRLRITNCPRCGLDMTEHSWIVMLNLSAEIIRCNNADSK